jgi:hypothetical protein
MMKKHDIIIMCLSVLALFGIGSTAFALPQYPGETPFESQESTTLTLFCSTGFFDSSQPVSVPSGKQDNAGALPVTQDSVPLAAPEPSSLILLALGLLFGLRTWLKRRKR